jgi:outer membrane protein TolC
MKWASLLLFFLISAAPVVAQDSMAAEDTTAAGETLTLQRAISMAYRNNLSLEVERMNPEISAAGVSYEKAKFQPLFSANINANDSNQPTGSRLSGEASSLNSKDFAYDFSLQQVLSTGTSYSVQFNNSRVRTNQLFSTYNPRYDSSLFAGVSQPLLRNFGLDITRGPLLIAQKNRVASDQRLRQKVMDIGVQVEQAYWDLAYARRLLDVVKQSLAYAQDLYENNKKQVEVGTMAPLEVVVAEAEVAAREQEIIQTEALIRNTEDHLRTLIIGKEMTDWDVPIIPSEKPSIQPLDITEEEAIQHGLESNPDLQALQINVEADTLNTKLAANALKPQLDLRAQVGFSGLGGERLVYGGDVLNPVPIGTEPGGYGDALSSLWDNRTFAVGFVVGIPIGNGQAKASYIQADLQQKQAVKTLENARQQTVLSIRTTFRNIQSDLKVLDAAKVNRVLQEKKLDAERKKLNVGLSTNNVVLDFQQDLARAQGTELQAMVSYLKDVASLNRLMGATWTGE